MAVYGVIGFVVLQLIELATATWGVPIVVLEWSIWATIAGAPLVAWLTWKFDITPWGVLMTPATGSLPAAPTGLIDRRIEFGIVSVLLIALGFGIREMVDDLGDRQAGTGTAQRATTTQMFWDAFADDVVVQLFDIWPHMAVRAGDHRFDGRLPDYSLEGLAGQIAVLRSLLDRARGFDGQRLDRQRAFERELVIWYMDRSLFWLETARWPQRNPAHYRSILSPRVYVDRPYAPLETRLVAFTRFLEGVPILLDQMRDRLKLPLPAPYRDLALGFFTGMARYLEQDVPAVFAPVLSGDAAARFVPALEGAVRAYRDAESWIEAQPETDASFAMGLDLYRTMLRRSELLDETLEGLRVRAESDLARNRAALEDACRALEAGLSVRDCVLQVEADKPAGGPVAHAAEQLVQLRDFVLAENLVSIPSDALAQVADSPPYRRANMAYIDVPGPLEPAGLPSTYYVAPPDPSWEPAVQQAFIPGRARLMFISSHEVWPGHFLHGLHRGQLDRPLLKLLGTGVFSEGWAHYVEEMMWEAGFGNDDPNLRIGQLLGALKRNVRFVSSIGLHTGDMSVAESRDLFLEQAFTDLGNARQQAARGTYDPGYFNYTLGKLLIRELRDEWLEQRGRPADWKAFHDTLLSFGSPPLPLVRRYMLTDSR
jgi:hypothetical protein